MTVNITNKGNGKVSITKSSEKVISTENVQETVTVKGGARGETGPQGPQGIQGIQGDTGEPGIVQGATPPVDTDVLWADTTEAGDAVIPIGGTTGQVLAKASNSDYATEWVDVSAGSTQTGVPDDPIVLAPVRWMFVTGWYDRNGGPDATPSPTGQVLTANADGAFQDSVNTTVTNNNVLVYGRFNGTTGTAAVGDRVGWMDLYNGGWRCGVYTITDLGSPTSPFVLTRAEDCNDATENGLAYTVALQNTSFYAKAAWDYPPSGQVFDVENGNYDFAVTSTSGGVVGSFSASIGKSSAAMGFGSSATGFSSIALGDSSEALATRSVAIGQRARATESESIAIGNYINGRVTNAVTIGPQVILQDWVQVWDAYINVLDIGTDYYHMGRYYKVIAPLTVILSAMIEDGQSISFLDYSSGNLVITAPLGNSLDGPNLTQDPTTGELSVTSFGNGSMITVKRTGNGWIAWATPPNDGSMGGGGGGSLPVGGTAKQALLKQSATDYDAAWTTTPYVLLEHFNLVTVPKNTLTYIPFSIEKSDTYGMHAPNSDTIYIPTGWTGLWSFNCTAAFLNGTAGDHCAIRQLTNGDGLSYYTTAQQSSSFGTAFSSVDLTLSSEYYMSNNNASVQFALFYTGALNSIQVSSFRASVSWRAP